jgi:hypothetical protein
VTRPAAGLVLVHLGRAAWLAGGLCLMAACASTSHGRFVRLGLAVLGLEGLAAGLLWAGQRLAAQEGSGDRTGRAPSGGSTSRTPLRFNTGP